MLFPENANGNGSRPPGDSVTVCEAAQRLGFTLPRLQRLLKRPEFAPHVHQAERPTRTGTRTVTLVSVSVLEALRSTESEQKRKQYGANRYRSEAGERSKEEGADGETSGPLVQAVIGQMEARLHDKDAVIEHLRRQLDEANERQRLTLEALSREQTLRALAAPVPDVSAQAQEGPQEAPQGPQASDSGEVAAEAGPGGESVVEEQSRRRSWWPFGRKETSH
jgi:hypothetical protein